MNETHVLNVGVETACKELEQTYMGTHIFTIFLKEPNYITMKKKQVLFLILGLLCVGAAIAMYIIGNDSSKLSELKDYWWVPVPLGILAFGGAFKKK